MSMTLREMLQNPPGKNTRQVAARYREIESLERRYAEAIRDPKRRTRFGLRISKWENGVWAHIRVPSEENKTDFDVILQLDFSDPVTSPTTAMGANVRVFCNSPSWHFVYAFVANAMGILPPGFTKAVGPRGISDPPDTTNPSRSYGFDKVVHVGALFLLNQFGSGPQSCTRSRLEAAARGAPPSPGDVTFEKKYEEYQRNEAAEVAKRRLAREKAKEASQKPAQAPANASKSSKGAAPKKGVTAAKSVKSVAASKGPARAGTRRPKRV